MSKVDTDRSLERGAPTMTWPLERMMLKSTNLTPPLSEESSMDLA
jgi:hypothetical protein